MLLAACAPKSAAPIQLTQKSSGSTQMLSVGQKLIVSLESNPTTGYRWAVDGEVPPPLEQVGNAKYTPGSTALGAGGTEVWTFSAKAAGKGTLKMKYWRSFEPTATPADTFQVMVNVK